MLLLNFIILLQFKEVSEILTIKRRLCVGIRMLITTLQLLAMMMKIHHIMTMCGSTRWKAAKSRSKTMTNLDETEFTVAGCRHAVAKKAVNMFRGEMYVEPCL